MKNTTIFPGDTVKCVKQDTRNELKVGELYVINNIILGSVKICTLVGRLRK